MERSLPFTLLPVLALAASGCMGGGTGTVGFGVSDAPVDDYSHVNVTFSRGSIHKAGGDNESESGWITVVNSTRTVDMIAIHESGSVADLGFAEVDAGKYTQIRLYVDAVVATKKSDGSQVTMTVPSNVVRTTKSFEVKDGGNTTLTLEFDLDRSITCNNQGCRFSPVLGKVEASEK